MTWSIICRMSPKQVAQHGDACRDPSSGSGRKGRGPASHRGRISCSKPCRCISGGSGRTGKPQQNCSYRGQNHIEAVRKNEEERSCGHAPTLVVVVVRGEGGRPQMRINVVKTFLLDYIPMRCMCIAPSIGGTTYQWLGLESCEMHSRMVSFVTVSKGA